MLRPGGLNRGLCIGFFLLLKLPLASAAIQLQQTRLVYPAGEPSVELVISNSDTAQAVAIASWVETDRRDITLAPVNLIIKPASEGVLSIHIPDSEPYSRQEKLYWLDVKGTPLAKSLFPERLAISVINRIKVLYRPQNLFYGAKEAYKKLRVGSCGGKLIIKNPTPYYISFYSFKADGKEVPDVKMIGPYENRSVPQATGQHSVARWQAILDTGFHSLPITHKITTGCLAH